MSLKLVCSIVILLSAVYAAPKLDPKTACRICPAVIKEFLENPSFDEKIFENVCAKLLNTPEDNPIVKVCAAGFIGEVGFLNDQWKGLTDKQICEKLHVCPA